MSICNPLKVKKKLQKTCKQNSGFVGSRLVVDKIVNKKVVSKSPNFLNYSIYFTVVVLNNPPVPGKVTRNNKSFVRFWPEDGYSSYGPVFSINTVDMKHHADFTMWHFRLGKKEIAPHRYIIIKARIPTVKKRRLHPLRSFFVIRFLH